MLSDCQSTAEVNGNASKLPWNRPLVTEVTGPEADEIRRAFKAEQAPAGIGHNSGAQMPKDESGKAPAWATLSNLALDEAAKANIGPGRHRHQLEAMIEGVFDPRLGISPLPLQLLAAVI